MQRNTHTRVHTHMRAHAQLLYGFRSATQQAFFVVHFCSQLFVPFVKMDSKSKKEKFQETLKSLNESQRESVLSNVNTLQILAGPGSGKTRFSYIFFCSTHVLRIFFPPLTEY